MKNSNINQLNLNPGGGMLGQEQERYMRAARTKHVPATLETNKPDRLTLAITFGAMGLMIAGVALSLFS